LQARDRVRALAASVGCDIHPVNNRRVLEALRHDFGADAAAVQRWSATWIAAGFDAIEALRSDRGLSRGRAYRPIP
jgi:maleylpyruvate isomerase